MFIENKYKIWYHKIIDNARLRISPIDNECHHILPKSLGGNNDKTNLVDLTLREHYVCHLLLTKFTIGDAKKKMFYALHRLTNKSDSIKIKSSRIYEYLRLNHSQITSQRMKENNPNKLGRKPTAKQSAAISKANTERIWTKESKDKMSQSQKQRKIDRPESFNPGIPKSEEHKKNLSISKIKKTREKDIDIFHWTHSIYGEFIGTRTNLSDSFPEQNLKISELLKVINPKYVEKSHRGWKLT
jgi:hypothetical protein